MISKPLKDTSDSFDRYDKSNILSFALANMRYFFKMYMYYPVTGFFSTLHERISRSWAFAKIGYLSYDFESAYLYQLMSFKLKRIYECLEDGHAIQEDLDMNALKEAIDICDRLFKGSYEDKYYEAHDLKWGELHMSFEKHQETKYYRSIFNREKVKTEQDEIQERLERIQMMEDAEKDRRADIDRLADILKNHENTWWD